MGKTIYNDIEFNVWSQKSMTSNDFGRIINNTSDDLGKNQITPISIHQLYLLASNSKKFASIAIPRDVVTINSEVILMSEKNQMQYVKIVFPSDIEAKNDVSVYSPIGLACLGAKEKSYVFFKQGNTVQKILIHKIIFQPEKEKLFYL